VIYQQRNELLEATDVAETVESMVRGEIDGVVRRYVPPESVEEQWDLAGLETTLGSDYQLKADVAAWVAADADLSEESLRERVVDMAVAQWRGKEELAGPEVIRQFERSLMLQTLDQHWREHLANLDHLRQGIHLRGYAQKNPKQEYKREAFELFSDMLDRIKQDVVRVILTVQVRTQEDVQAVEEPPPVSNVRYQHADFEEALAGPAEGDSDAAVATAAPKTTPFTRAGEKIGRNDPCPCGSGKKYKQCHGRLG
jgi:preprotein translocase subunit SecA